MFHVLKDFCNHTVCPKGIRWYLVLRCYQQQILYDHVVQHTTQMLGWIKIWRIWRQSQHLKLAVVHLQAFPNRFCFVAVQIIQLRDHKKYGLHDREYLVFVLRCVCMLPTQPSM
ncbi:hypothetical protein GOODEAATRI_030279 [Goodea atripinnis]|uniref:Uncharacterized protein n=1 Tax=Goodea atripinnis TaxID=208336 RepID=A0ABV0NPD2_9TELE